MDLRFLSIIPICVILAGCGSRYDELSLEEVSSAKESAPESEVLSDARPPQEADGCTYQDGTAVSSVSAEDAALPDTIWV